MPVSSGRWLISSVNASSPPAEAPIPTIVGQVLSARSSWAGTTAAAETEECIRLLPVFATHHHYLSLNEKPEHAHGHSFKRHRSLAAAAQNVVEIMSRAKRAPRKRGVHCSAISRSWRPAADP